MLEAWNWIWLFLRAETWTYSRMLSVATSLPGCARRMQTRSSYCRTGSSGCYLQLLPSQTRSKDRIARGVGCKYFAMRHTEAKDTQTNKQTHTCGCLYLHHQTMHFYAIVRIPWAELRPILVLMKRWILASCTDFRKVTFLTHNNAF